MSVPFYLGSFFASLLLRTRSTYVSEHTNACTAVEKRSVCGIVLVPAIAAGRLRGVLRLSFDVKHVRHEEYVNNANKTLFIARAAPSLFYHCFLCNLFRLFCIFFYIVKARCILDFVAFDSNDISAQLSHFSHKREYLIEITLK